MVPLVLAAFANAPDLSKLTDERTKLLNVFTDHQKMELICLNDLTHDYLTGQFAKSTIRECTTIFHYAGHADGRNIQMADTNAKIEGLALLLKKLPNLQLVFLNGCDTYDQVKILLDAGIKAVIATIGPVEDTVATDFAYYFYHAFYNLNTLSASFDFAQGNILSKYKKDKGDDTFVFYKSYRSFGFGDEPAIGAGDIYTLHVSEEKLLEKNILFNIDYVRPAPQPINYKPCRKLIDAISESILEGNYSYSGKDFLNSDDYETIKKRYDAYRNQRENERFMTDLSNEILRHLPFPIGFHLRCLFAPGRRFNTDEERITLLKQQISSYNIFLQLLSFSMLSCFMDILTNRKDLEIWDGQWKVLDNFICSQEPDNALINSPALLVTIREIFEKNGIDPFITEYQKLRDVFKSEDEFYSKHLFIQGLSATIANKEIYKLDVRWLCDKTEDILRSIFLNSGFIVRYKLTTIKDIEYRKARDKQAKYWIRRIILDRPEIDNDYKEAYDAPTDSHSVIFARATNKQDLTKFINLSPFIIDENSLKGVNLSRLLFYSHKKGDNYIFRWSDNREEFLEVKQDYTYDLDDLHDTEEEEVMLINQRMSEIKEQLDYFHQLINTKKIHGSNASIAEEPVSTL